MSSPDSSNNLDTLHVFNKITKPDTFADRSLFETIRLVKKYMTVSKKRNKQNVVLSNRERTGLSPTNYILFLVCLALGDFDLRDLLDADVRDLRDFTLTCGNFTVCLQIPNKTSYSVF